MSYITTNHRFIIDDKHPTDVFNEMENFFSLYTVTVDDLQRVSIQLSVPPSFDMENKKIAESYRQFAKSLKYTIPDLNLLPVKIRENGKSDEEQDSNDDNSVTLLIQRYDGYVAEEEEESTSFVHSILGKLTPSFAKTQSDTGLYPIRQAETLPEPLPPITPQPIAKPQPQQQPPQYQPQPIQQPVQSQVQTPIPQMPPVVTPVQPQPVQQAPIARSQPIPPVTPQQTVTPKPTLSVLPNIQKSATPYQDLLTQAIVDEAKKLVDKTQAIHQITLKSNDSLTTAMIEQLFNSFNHAHDKTIYAHDAIDLVSYGFEVLKTKLSAIGVKLSDEAQFGLKTKAQSTPADIARLQRGEVFSNEIKLGVKFVTTANNAIQSTTSHNVASQPNANNTVPPQFQAKLQNPNFNQNLQHIALTIKSTDGLGERQQKVRQFPIVFASRDAQIPHAIRLFAPNSVNFASGVYFSIIESDGQVLIDDIDPNVSIHRNGQTLKQYDVLMPNDVLEINNVMSVQLLLAN